MRDSKTWSKIFQMISDETTAQGLLLSLEKIPKTIILSKEELDSIHTALDYMNLFKACGFRIKGEKTESTKIVVDVLYKNWNILEQHMPYYVVQHYRGTLI